MGTAPLQLHVPIFDPSGLKIHFPDSPHSALDTQTVFTTQLVKLAFDFCELA